MPFHDPDQMFGLVLHDVSRLLRRRYEQRLRATGLGLTRAQCAVLVNLARQQGTNQACLAQVLDIEPITLVRLLDRLESVGLIARKPAPKDRRAYVLELTAKARPVLDKIYDLALEIYDEALTGMSKTDTARLLSELHTIKANLIAMTDTSKPASRSVRSKRRA